METLCYLLFSPLLFLVAGIAPVCWVWRPEQAPLSRVVWAPIAGVSVFMVVCHRLAAFGLTGRQVVWIALPAVAIPALLIPASRRLRREEWREALPVLLAGLGCLLLANWALISEGYLNYMAFGNPDAAFNVGVWRSMMDLPYGQVPLTGFAATYPIPAPGIIFGSAYLGILISAISGAEILALHQVVCGAFAFLAPLSTWLLARRVFSASPSQALTVAVMTAALSQVTFLVVNQSLGAVQLQVLLPAVLVVWDVALRPFRWPVAAFASIVTIGVAFGYYAALPIVVGMAGATFLAAVVRRDLPLPRVVSTLVALAAISLVAFPSHVLNMVSRTSMEATSGRLEATLSGSEVLLQFAFSLTELGLPYTWGIDYPHYRIPTYTNLLADLGGIKIVTPSAAAAYLLGMAMCGLAVWGLWRARSAAKWAIRLQVAMMAGAMAAYLLKHNGYGVFKFASWWCPVFMVCAVAGAMAFDPVLQIRMRTAALVVLGLFALTNLASTLNLVRFSQVDYPDSKSTTPGYRLQDFLELREGAARVPQGEKILLAVTDIGVQDWAAVVLGAHEVVLAAHRMGGGTGSEGPAPQDAVFERGYEGAQWLLTYRNIEPPGGSQPGSAPVWQNRRFQLIPASHAAGRWTLGAGWYGAERISEPTAAWQRDFRWLRRSGDVLISGATQPLRLLTTVVSGPGDPRPNRRLRLRLDGQVIEEFEIEGSASLMSQPFRAAGVKAKLTLELDDTAKPISRNWGINSWVPVDARRLNLAVIGLRLEPANMPEATHYATIGFPLESGRLAPPYNGIFLDGWVAGRAVVKMETCGPKPAIRVKGEAPAFPGRRFPVSVETEVGGLKTVHRIARAGEFEVWQAAPEGDQGCRLVDLAVRPLDPGFRAPRDARPLTIRIREIAAGRPALPPVQ